ncbi:MAG TPA: hypothetical protein VGJ28_26205 [Micromonosporaceae bacterium]
MHARLVVSCVDYPLDKGPQLVTVRAFDAGTHAEVNGVIWINGEHRSDMLTNRGFAWMLGHSDVAIVCVDGYPPMTCALTVDA